MSLTQASFTAGQLTFIKQLVASTNLNAGVVAAWCYQEENGGAAQARQAAGNHNWLNIGYFDSGPGKIAFNSAFSNPTTAANQTAQFLEGKWGGPSAGIRAILASAGQLPTTQIRAIQTSGWATSGEPLLPTLFSEISPTLIQDLGSSILTGGGVFGLNGTGTSGNPVAASLWTVGNSANPHQDYWTTMNQYAQNAQMYLFSDGEQLFLADGIRLMAQTPQVILVRTDPALLTADMTYDNSAFSYVTDHVMKGKVIRRASLARVTSPTSLDIKLICDVDLLRGGDTVYLKRFGPADGIWLVGTTRRSIYTPFTEVTLVQALQPVNANSGLPFGPGFLTGKQAVTAPGTAIHAMISRASTINNADFPYVWGGGHGQAGTPSIGQPGGPGYDGHSIGYDCSGSVAAVLAAGGLWQTGASVPSSNGVVDELLSSSNLRGSPAVAPGSGSGIPECTLYDSPNHIFMRLDGQFWGTADGSGHLPAVPNGGPGWIPNGQPAPSGFRVTHVPAAILGQQGS